MKAEVLGTGWRSSCEWQTEKTGKRKRKEDLSGGSSSNYCCLYYGVYFSVQKNTGYEKTGKARRRISHRTGESGY